jgi:hypothetical protein
MQTLNLVWIDLLVLALGLCGVNSAFSGELRTYGRGGHRLVLYRLPGIASRIGCAIAGLLILCWVVFDLRRKFPT